jgi:ParB family transcriptional regulator, chromosome partitioning protein
MARKGGLGKGLGALIPSENGTNDQSGTQFVSVNSIQPNPRQPRSEMDDAGLQELSASIREFGILQPLIVTSDNGQEPFTLIAGERRLRAARLAGLESVPVLVRQASDQERLEIALIENVQRTDLSPLESAAAYHQLGDEFGLTHEEIAARLGKSREAVTNTLRLLKLSSEAQSALKAGKISEGHARALLGLATPQAQNAALQTILNLSLSVRQAEELVRKLNGNKSKTTLKPSAPPEISEIEGRLREALGTRVNLHHGKRGGSLVIHYYSDEELDAIISQILKEQ